MLQTKSYIAPIKLSDPQQWEPDTKSCEAALAAVVSCGTKFGENPADGTKESGNYRLLSQVKIDATCTGGKVSNWNVHSVEMDFGKEFYFISTSGNLGNALTVSPSTTGNTPVDKIIVSYRVRGQPNAAGVALMNLVKSRTCSNIWHEVSGTIACKAGQPTARATLIGSAFPSHSMCVQGQLVKNIPQGPFRNLWKCDPTDPVSVQ